MRSSLGTMLTAAALSLSPLAATADDSAPPNRTLGYVTVGMHWTTYTTPGAKVECPQGLYKWGPREQYKALFPDDGTKRSTVETHLAREIAGWFPDTTPDKFPWYDIEGTVSYGFNLDGKVDASDFTSPEGEKGIDNQLYRAIGCIRNYRWPDGSTTFFANEGVGKGRWNRTLMEITNVDSMLNDDSVDVTLYHGLADPILQDASGDKYIPGGTHRVDTRWGKKMIQHFHGKIVDGVLLTDVAPAGAIPAGYSGETSYAFRDMRMKLKLTADRAEGMIGGYVDVDRWYWQQEKNSTHYHSYGETSIPSLYKAMRRLADAYPDPKTGANTALSAALDITFLQAFILHDEHKKEVSSPTVASAPSDSGSRSAGQ